MTASETALMTPDEIHELQRYVARCDPDEPLVYLNGEEWYDIHPLVRRAPEVRARLDAPT